jgi:hypothetical protein
MVAKITTPVSINRALNYNEQKVQKGTAKCLFAGNFLYQAAELNFYQKLGRFQRLTEQNSSKTNTLHISLNFHPSENLSKEKLIEIAESYINKIGFGEQPFLVYQHFDAGHPHLHIVTTTIQENGKRINTFNIGRNLSEKARQDIEDAYRLVNAAGKNLGEKDIPRPVNVQRANYGLSETKRSITNVLAVVIDQYKYTSLAELNAILKLYNVTADRGTAGSRIYNNRGLIYRLLDEKGNKVGVPIKASSIYCKPTLGFLEERFAQNESLRAPFKSRLKTAIDWSMSKNPASLAEFILSLQKEKLSVVIHENDQGFIYGITFIDHRTKTVFNGSELGKEYSAKAIQERIARHHSEKKKFPVNLLDKKDYRFLEGKINKETLEHSKQSKEALEPSESFSSSENLLELLLNKERNDMRVPFGFIKKKKKRKPRL